MKKNGKTPLYVRVLAGVLAAILLVGSVTGVLIYLL